MKIYRLGKKNFIVIGFDGLPHNFFENLIKNKKESEYLKDFIVYNNVIVPFPTTKLSLFSEFNNINKINNDKNLSEEIKKRNYIFKDDKGILVYGAYNQIIKKKNR